MLDEKETKETKEVEFEVVNVDDKEIETSVLEESKTINVKIPESIANDPDAIEAFKADIEKTNKEKLLPNIYRNQSKYKQAIADRDAEIERLKAEGKRDTTEIVKTDKSEVGIIKPIWERMGLNSEDELDDPDNYTPSQLRKAQSAYYEELAEAKAEAKLKTVMDYSKTAATQSMLSAKIVQDGNNPEEFNAWLEYQRKEGNALQYNDGAYRLYKQARADKTDPILGARAHSQEWKINYVEKGNNVKFNNTPKTEAEIAAMTPQQKADYKAYLIKKAELERG